MVNGLVGGGELARLASGPARVTEQMVRLNHRVETKDLKAIMFESCRFSWSLRRKL